MTLFHTALWVSDVERSVEFYGDLLGYEVVREFENDAGVRNVFLGHPDPEAADDAAVQLMPADGPVETGDFEHVALETDDVDAAVEWLADDLVESGPTTMDEFDVRVAFVEDPDGWGIELIERL